MHTCRLISAASIPLIVHFSTAFKNFSRLLINHTARTTHIQVAAFVQSLISQFLNEYSTVQTAEIGVQTLARADLKCAPRFLLHLRSLPSQLINVENETARERT